MPRTQRYIRSGAIYEICLRTREGLPFPTWETMSLIIKSAIARTQRDEKVTLCHYKWMGNHPHILIQAHDPQQCVKFYMELKKKITDAIKRLTGKKYLNLWEDRTMLAEVLDLDCMIERISYAYTNAARANLVETISEYPGISSWNAFCNASSIHSEIIEKVPRINLTKIKKLSRMDLTPQQDKMIAAEYVAQSKETQQFIIKPNAWMKIFGIETQEEVQKINDRIKERIQKIETELKIRRSSQCKPLGATRLKKQGISWNHIPRKKNRNIFVLSTIQELRIEYIKMFQELQRRCADLYRQACLGARNILWPPGTFVPSLPPNASALR